MGLAFSELGAGGETIIILHGLFGSRRNWAAIARKLAVNNRVLTLDLPNHGASSWTGSMSYELLSESISDFIVEHELKDATVLGHSMGGKVAMTLALTQPDLIKRLIVADIAPVEYHHDNFSVITALESVDLKSIKTRSDADKHLMEKISEPMMRLFLLQNLVHSEDQYKWRINIPVIKKGLPSLHGFPSFSENIFFNGPTLFLAGARSDFIEPNHHKNIAHLFPKSSIINIAGAGHWIHADNPEAFINSVVQFISSS
jgi:pimeloyl-ACP methyl ester carboxylesterase